jgi:cytochrome c oxidase subunit 2
MPKTDLIAGRVNETWLRAERTGRFRGQCAEYCGLQHAYMAFMVVAEPADRLDAWLERLSRPGAAPNDTGHLGGWIANSQTIKPGNAMPPQPVPAADLPALIAYLQTLT